MTYNELCEAILKAQEGMLKHKIEANSVTLNGRKYGKLIENIPPNIKPTIFGMAVKADNAMPDDYDFIVQYEPPQPQTNADRIRGMTDEELARLFDDILKYNVVGEPDENVCSDCYKTDCAPCWLDWLKAEVDDGT